MEQKGSSNKTRINSMIMNVGGHNDKRFSAIKNLKHAKTLVKP